MKKSSSRKKRDLTDARPRSGRSGPNPVPHTIPNSCRRFKVQGIPRTRKRAFSLSESQNKVYPFHPGIAQPVPSACPKRRTKPKAVRIADQRVCGIWELLPGHASQLTKVRKFDAAQEVCLKLFRSAFIMSSRTRLAAFGLSLATYSQISIMSTAASG